MGTPKPPLPVKLIAGVLASSDALLEQAATAMTERFGPTDATSTATAWKLSAYYREEMGEVIRRQFLSFEALIDPGSLIAVKQATNAMENTWRHAGGRRVNIDPGYLAAAKLVLASTKDAAQRVYLGEGIYAEATLHYDSGALRPYRHTYPDYALPDTLAFFERARAAYLEQLRSGGHAKR